MASTTIARATLSGKGRTILENAIDKRESFDANGTLSGNWHSGPYRVSLGKASEAVINALTVIADNHLDVYVIHSYATPIAWFTVNDGWTIPTDKFSVTTSKQQNIIRTIVRDYSEAV